LGYKSMEGFMTGLENIESYENVFTE